MKYLAPVILLICLGVIAFRVLLPYATDRLEIRLICAIGVGVFLLAARVNRKGHKGNRDVANILCIASALGMAATFLPKPDAHENWQPAYSILLPFSIPAAFAVLAMLWPDDNADRE
jgi:hypothetical protein